MLIPTYRLPVGVTHRPDNARRFTRFGITYWDDAERLSFPVVLARGIRLETYGAGAPA
jgi:hypothetical protein